MGFLSIFVLGFLIEFARKAAGVEQGERVSFTLMGTVKNSGFTAATALALFSERASVPGTVVTVFIVLYLVLIGIQAQRRGRRPQKSA